MLLLYRQTHPATALVLAADSHYLTFRRPAASTSTAGPQIELSLDPLADFDALGCTLLGRVHASLGLVCLNNDIFLCVVSSANSLTSRNTPQEQTYRITSVDFYSVSSASWDDYNHHDPGTAGGAVHAPLHGQGSGAAVPTTKGGHGGSAGRSLGIGGSSSTDSFDSSVAGTGAASPVLYEHPATSMHKILSNGHFYFSSGTYDVTTRLEERMHRKECGDSDVAYDPRFIWNGFLMDSMLEFRQNLEEGEKQAFDEAAFVVPAIQGFIGRSDFTLSGNPVTLSVISRLGSARAGTRFNARGIDDDGNVANFVETETIFRSSDTCFSFVQVRGSVPLFWEQQGGNPFGGQKLQITRPAIASQPAFNKHFTGLLASYQRVQAVNLLSTKDHEALLTSTYRDHLRNLNAQLGEKEGPLHINEKASDEVGFAEFDFHREVKSVGGIENIREVIRRDPHLGGLLHTLGYFLVTLNNEGHETTLTRQEGVYRTNCLDCLDRTNVVQAILSRLSIDEYMGNIIPAWAGSDILLNVHRGLWAENGDALSKIYAGTGAINTSFTRNGKRTLAGALSDATKSAARLYISNFLDKNKQLAIDSLLGNISTQKKVVVVDPIRDSMESALRHRLTEYSTEKDYHVHCGTFNVNGKVPQNESILPWLFPRNSVEPDIIALGFQELVELSPQQIMATDPEKMRRWQVILEEAISSRHSEKAKYVLLRAEQLVGTALIVLVKTSIVSHIRNVETASKKTGLKGMAGNKGAVALRLELDDASFCFITAHFAAGHSNFEQRNLDYATIAHGLHFRRGRRISTHDNVLFCGDLNYRISLPNEHVRVLAVSDDYADLVEGDQLTMCMGRLSVFAGYSEGPLVFRPTYKYDNNSDAYDTSEKQRVPSWTDRVLYKGKSMSLLEYDRAELRLSDHRPVYALFRVRVNAIDSAKKEAIARELLATLSPRKARSSITHSALANLLDDIDEALPPSSTDTVTWWQDTDLVVVTHTAALNQSKRNPTVDNPFDKDYFFVPVAYNKNGKEDLLDAEPTDYLGTALLQPRSQSPAAVDSLSVPASMPTRSASVKRKPVPHTYTSNPITKTSAPALPPKLPALPVSPQTVQPNAEAELRSAISDNIFLQADRAHKASSPKPAPRGG